MSKGNVAEPKQQTDLQKDGELMDHASEEGDESTASDIGMEAEQKQTAPEPASAQKAIFSPVDDTVIVADSLPNEDAAAPPSQKAGMIWCMKSMQTFISQPVQHFLSLHRTSSNNSECELQIMTTWCHVGCPLCYKGCMSWMQQTPHWIKLKRVLCSSCPVSQKQRSKYCKA